MKQLINIQKRYTRKKTIEETEEFDDELLEDIYHPTRESIERHLLQAEEDIENGRLIPIEEVFKELRDEFGY